MCNSRMPHTPTRPDHLVGLEPASTYNKALFAATKEGGNPLRADMKPIKENKKNIHQMSFASAVHTEPARQLRANILAASLFPNIFMPKKIGAGSPEDLP